MNLSFIVDACLLTILNALTNLFKSPFFLINSSGDFNPSFFFFFSPNNSVLICEPYGERSGGGVSVVLSHRMYDGLRRRIHVHPIMTNQPDDHDANDSSRSVSILFVLKIVHYH